MALKDERIKVINEVLSGIKVPFDSMLLLYAELHVLYLLGVCMVNMLVFSECR